MEMASAMTATTAADDGPQFDNYEAAPFDHDLYRAQSIATGVSGLDAVDDEAIAFYREFGFLVVQDAFTPREVADAVDGLLDLIDGKVAGYRGIQYELKAREKLPTLTREEKQDHVRKLIYYVEHDARLKAMETKPELRAVASRLLARPGEANGPTPSLWADQALLKPPLIGREKPWHQDHAFFNLPMGTPVVGCWIALDEAVIENGCMHVIPGTQAAGPVVHFRRRDWQICDSSVELGKIAAVPLRPGGLLFFDGLLHHGTPPSRSARRRRALQFHFIPEGTVKTSPEERMAVFGSEGKDVEC
jgi:phytanoyl-CoA hydroxylase